LKIADAENSSWVLDRRTGRIVNGALPETGGAQESADADDRHAEAKIRLLLVGAIVDDWIVCSFVRGVKAKVNWPQKKNYESVVLRRFDSDQWDFDLKKRILICKSKTNR